MALYIAIIASILHANQSYMYTICHSLYQCKHIFPFLTHNSLLYLYTGNYRFVHPVFNLYTWQHKVANPVYKYSSYHFFQLKQFLFKLITNLIDIHNLEHRTATIFLNMFHNYFTHFFLSSFMTSKIINTKTTQCLFQFLLFNITQL